MTEAVKEAIRARVEDAKEELVGNGFGASEFDQFTRGMIKAFREVLDVKLEDVKSTEEMDADEIYSSDISE